MSLCACPGYQSHLPAYCACLVLWDWEADTLNVTVLPAGFCCIPFNSAALLSWPIIRILEVT